ncbi:MAG: PilZ domain-containing protein [Turneriella sp.]|nr:PilZ domain-containing protein [Turneriella sp.]
MQQFTDTCFFIFGESPQISELLRQDLSTRKARVQVLQSLGELQPCEDAANILIAHESAISATPEFLDKFKSSFPDSRVILLCEPAERRRIGAALLEHTDQILEKPFPLAQWQNALSQLRFRPLEGKTVVCWNSAEENPVTGLLESLGARCANLDSAKSSTAELAIFAAANFDSAFREAVQQLRQDNPELPIMLLAPPTLSPDTTILSEIAYLLPLAAPKRILRQKILDFFAQPQRDRRKAPRKKGIAQFWVAAFNPALAAPELFESPHLLDISQSGLAFQTPARYQTGQKLLVWIVAEDYPEKIVELRAIVRWQKPAEEKNQFRYGVEFERDDTEAFRSFLRMVAMR